MTKLRGVLWLAVTLLAAGTALADDDAVDVPRLDKRVSDGKPDGWGNAGFQVNLMADAKGNLLSPKKFDAKFRLAWNDKGLLALVTVVDDSPSEAAELAPDAQGDVVELLVGDRLGSDNRYDAIISPGVDPKFPKPRQAFDAWPAAHGRLDKMTVQYACRKTPDGYVVEALLPWDNLGIAAKEGTTVAFRIKVRDYDAGKFRTAVSWNPSGAMVTEGTVWHKLRLSSKAAEPVNMLAMADYLRTTRIAAAIVGDASLAGKGVKFYLTSTRDEKARAASPEPLGQGVFAVADGRAVVHANLPVPQVGQNLTGLWADVNGLPTIAIALQPADRMRAQAMIRQRVVPANCCFEGETLPECDFEQPIVAESLIGPYSIKATYYDADFNVATKAAKVGRYGAVVEVQPEAGRPFKRFCTLCRIEGPANNRWGWLGSVKMRVELPAESKLARDALAREGESGEDWLRGGLIERARREPESAALMAHLYEINGTDRKIDFYSDGLIADRQWWVTLKRKLNGTDKVFLAKPFAEPTPLKDPAPVIHDGSLAEAAMKPDAAERIDAACKAWAADSDEAFAVCVARNGVIVLHKAYGTRDGKPMTVETTSWMASITKLMGATLMTQMVDQGLVGLDDRVDKFLPAFRGFDVPVPLTVRHCYTHTSGLFDHGWDGYNDLEEMFAAYYPQMQVGRKYSYSGAGPAIGGKIMETISGEVLPTIFRKHLLEPLGCNATLVSDSAGGARSTPMDIAKIAQMLLNGGAYGQWRFFSEQTLAKMLPPAGEITVPGGAVVVRYGICTSPYDTEGFGPRTFGHGAASSAILRIDPDNKLVIVMTRNNAGRNYGKYVKSLNQAIQQSMLNATTRKD